jgi:putative colanic acid biosynthesis glycosyltransferase
MPLLSVLTVTKNSTFSLLKTFASLAPLLQRCTEDIEWIILDGCSTDTSCVCLRSIASSQLTNIKIHVESDSGIYNAMNKAVSFSSGKYALFLNSGDTIVSATADQFLKSSPDSASIYAYSYYIRDQKSSLVSKPMWIKKYLQGALSLVSVYLPSSHNSVIYPTSLIRQLPFKEEYACAADYEQYISARISGYKVKYILSKELSIIDCVGYISLRIAASYREYHAISYAYSNHFASLYWLFRLSISNL